MAKTKSSAGETGRDYFSPRRSKTQRMSGSGNVSYPAGFVADKNEQDLVWWKYGRDGERTGMRENMPPPSQVELMNSGLFTECGVAVAENRQPKNVNVDEYWDKCGPFRIDFWAAPIWFPIRDSDITDLPPR